MIRVIKNDADYKNALTEIEALIDQDPPRESSDANRLEVLTVLVRDYESKRFPQDLPDPIDAIEFRMDQEELTARDLIPYLGSRSKVSEILSRKRPLTLAMIRALSSGLGIPEKVLVQPSQKSEITESSIDWQRFPIREMISRGWIVRRGADIRNQGEQVRQFFAPLEPLDDLLPLFRQSNIARSAREMDGHALLAWTARIVTKASALSSSTQYRSGIVTLSFMQEVARLSASEKGPILARDFLLKHGIFVIIEPHLPRTYLDGAALLYKGKKPIIGLTIRHDRLDNFWFCLMHELAHISLHCDKNVSCFFYDDLDVESHDSREREADKLASEALIPKMIWEKSAASRLRSAEAVQRLAQQLSIHPAIVAGRVRHVFKDYRVLKPHVGYWQVRSRFSGINWD